MTTKRNYRLIITVLIILLLLVISAGGRTGTPAQADTSVNTNALQDLQKDGNFNLDDYPANSEDYSIQVIQIAESADGGLYLYTYQPCQLNKSVVAININMALSDSVDGTKLYALTPVDTSGVLCKYLVRGCNVGNIGTRYYNITSIYRPFEKGIDKETGNDNVINAVAFPVGQLWIATTENGTVTYQVRKTEVITVTDKYVGRVRYLDGFYLFAGESCDGWFVAFSADRDMEKLFEADVEYQSQYFYYKGILLAGNKQVVTEDKSDPEPHGEAKTLTYTEEVSNAGDGPFGKRYSWNRIESAKGFVAKEDLTDEAKKQLSGKQWVLRFTETEFRYNHNVATGIGNFLNEYTEISEVTILRLKFETAGKTYNLGVVDNKQTGNKIANKQFNPFDKSNWWIWLIIAVVAVIILIILIRVIVRRRREKAEEEERAKQASKRKKQKKKAGKKK